ncbi:MAG: hypothetical protein AAF065_06125 [Verrucomicrobiota bacterium]
MIYAIIAVIAGAIGFFAGKFHSVDVDELEEMTENLEGATEGLEDFTKQMDAFNSDNERHLKEKYELCIPLLDALEENDIEFAKTHLIEEFGRFYYNYTYEDERYMNTDTVEDYLKQFENKAKHSQSYQLIVSYQSED